MKRLRAWWRQQRFLKQLAYELHTQDNRATKHPLFIVQTKRRIWGVEVVGEIADEHQDIWEFVTAHFTEKAAQRYIDENKHNMTDPRVYVGSQYRCHEWNAVVDHLKGF